jgi:hypothetical protein
MAGLSVDDHDFAEVDSKLFDGVGDIGAMTKACRNISVLVITIMVWSF